MSYLSHDGGLYGATREVSPRPGQVEHTCDRCGGLATCEEGGEFFCTDCWLKHEGGDEDPFADGGEGIDEEGDGEGVETAPEDR